MTAAADLRAALAAACADVQHATDAAIKAHALCVYHSDDPAAMRRARDLYLVAATCIAAADEIDRLNAAVTELAAALNEAADDAEYYAQYLPGNLRTKWGVADDIARYRAIAAKHTPETGP